MSTNNNSGPWDGPQDRVTDDGETVSVGPDPAESARQRAAQAGSQQNRIEAKLDYLIAVIEGRNDG